MDRRTYFSLDLPDAEAALKLAEKICAHVAGPVTVADDQGNLIASLSHGNKKAVLSPKVQ
jgi:hypothetical protein